jgi:hypothetical protein
MVQLSETQMVSGTVTPVTKKGNPSKVQAGTSKFTSSDDTILKVVSPDPDDPTGSEMSVACTAVAPGAAQCRWTADADEGDGVVEISAVGDFVVVAGQAVGGTINFGTPREQP